MLQPLRAGYTRLRRYLGYLAFERSLGLETSRVATLRELGVDATDRSDYEPSPWLALRRVLPRRDVLESDVFIDFGSGKGPVVLQAARYPFKRVVGLELSSELHARALENVTRSRPTLRCTNVELVNEDALAYAIPDDVTVAYFYNPFRGAVFAQVVDNLLRSLERRPRTIRIIYMNPVEEAMLLAAGARLVRTKRGLRPGRNWSRLNTIKVYELSRPTDSNGP